MTNKEAIALLRNLEYALDSYCELSEEGKTAFRMAIEALSSSEFPNNSGTISRQAAIDAIDAILPVEPMKNEYTQGITCGAALAKTYVEQLPSAQPETTRILAEALNGSPLLYPCDKLWSREGWCKDHCKKGQTEPDTECWLKYAETIAAERREE